MTRAGIDHLVRALGGRPGRPRRGSWQAVVMATARTGPRLGHAVLAARLAAWARTDRRRRTRLADWLREAVGRLAPGGRPPTRGACAESWRVAVALAPRLHVAGAWPLSLGPMVDGATLARLQREATRRQPRRASPATAYAAPGPHLQRLAVDPRLCAAVADACGRVVRPAFTAVYMFDPPGAVVPPHLDTRAFPLVLHVVLSHDRPAGVRGSALVVYEPARTRRLHAAPGEALLLAGRGTVHRWAPLHAGERRTMAAIGFRVLTR